jgi:hypothetical protein
MSFWNKYLPLALENLKREGNTRDVGKLLALPNEYFQQDTINKMKIGIKVFHRDDMSDEANFEQDPNESGYDLITESGVRIQSKFRATSLHLETTRRNSKKNAGAASSSGHVAYSMGETDVFLLTVPSGGKPSKKGRSYEDIISFLENPEGAELIAIPESALEDPKSPGFIRPRVPMSIFNKYKGKLKEVLIDAEEEKRKESAVAA